MGKKSKEKIGNEKEKHGLRTPKTPSKAKRGLGNDVEIPTPQPISPQELVKKFGPCHVDAQQARTAILLLQSPETHIVLESLNCLQKFCKKRDENKRLFIEMNGLIEARKLVFNENQVIQRFSMKLIAITSSFHEATIQIRDFDMANDLITLAGSTDDVVVEYATFTLSSLAMLYTGRLQIVQNAGLSLIIHLLSHPDPDIQKNSAETLWRLTEEPLNIDLITSKGSIEPILKLIRSEYPALQIVVLSILERVSSRDPGVQVLENINAIHSFGELLGKPDFGDLHRVLLRILTNMSMNKTACRKILPLVPIIAGILDTSPDPSAQIYALGLLGLLSYLPVVAKGLVDFGMCKRLIKILNSHPDLEMKEAAAYCVFQLSQSDIRARQQFVEAIPPLIVMLDKEKLTNPGFEYIMMAFGIILEDASKACPCFINLSGLCTFTKIMQHRKNYSEDGILSLMNCIGLLTAHWSLRPYCVEAGLVPLLLNLLKTDENPQFLTAAANAMCGLLCHEKGRMQFLENDGHDVLIKFINHQEFPVVVAGVPIIHILGTYPDITKELIEMGILQLMWKRQDLISKSGPLRTAFERLISTHLPAKYAISGHIDPFQKLSHGFYDCGSLRSTECFQTMNQMTWENRDPQRKVLYLNWDANIDDEVALKNNKTLQIVKEQGQSCKDLVDEIRQGMDEIKSEKALVRGIAKAVAKQMGGVLDKWRVSAHTEDLQIADLQAKYQSVVIPITMITTGAFRPRAILFKALCDVFGIPCSVERGEYKRMWNVVLIQSRKPQKPPCPCGEDEDVAKSLYYTEKLRRFVVDLVYQPGALLPVNSYDANSYCFA